MQPCFFRTEFSKLTCGSRCFALFLLKKNNINLRLSAISMIVWLLLRQSFFAIVSKKLNGSPSRWSKIISLFHLCMVEWTKNKETKLWNNLDRAIPEFWYRQIYGEEVSTCNKFPWLSIMTFHWIGSFIFIVLVEAGDSEERELR